MGRISFVLVWFSLVSHVGVIFNIGQTAGVFLTIRVVANPNRINVASFVVNLELPLYQSKKTDFSAPSASSEFFSGGSFTFSQICLQEAISNHGFIQHIWLTIVILPRLCISWVQASLSSGLVVKLRCKRVARAIWNPSEIAAEFREKLHYHKRPLSPIAIPFGCDLLFRDTFSRLSFQVRYPMNIGRASSGVGKYWKLGQSWGCWNELLVLQNVPNEFLVVELKANTIRCSQICDKKIFGPMLCVEPFGTGAQFFQHFTSVAKVLVVETNQKTAKFDSIVLKKIKT